MIDPFRYIPPTDVTAPKHDAVNAAHAECADRFSHVLTGTPWLGDYAGHYDARVAHEAITDAARAFFDVVREHAPPSTDRSAAERCIRLARMNANEAIRSSDAATSADAVRRALDNLAEARLQANAAIALGGEA